MAAHVQIATETLTFTDKDGVLHTYDYTISQEGASSNTLPIKMTEVAYVFGSKSDPPEKQIKTTQVQFAIQQENRELLNRLRGARDKDFIFQIDETTDIQGETVERFKGYLNLASKSWTYYEDYPVMEFIAYDGLGTLKKTRFDSVTSGVETFDDYLAALLDLTGFTRDRWIFVSKQHEDVSDSDYWPSQYRHNVNHILREKNDQDRFAWDALVEFCTRFNLQLFYWEGKWIFMEREQRIRFADVQNRYNSSDNSYLERDKLVQAGTLGTKHYPQGEDLPGIGRLLYDWNIREPEIEGLQNNKFIASLDPWTINGTATYDAQDRASIPIEISDANSIEQTTTGDVLQPGDILQFQVDGSIRQDATSEATNFDLSILEIRIDSLDSATQYWLQGDGSWGAGSFLHKETGIDFPGTASPPDSHPYNMYIESDPIPDDPVDQRYELTVEVHAYAATVNSGANPDGIDYFNNVDHVLDTYQAERTDLATKRFQITTGDPQGEDLELDISLGDEDSSTGSFAMEYFNSPDWLDSVDWSPGTGDQQLAYLVALSYAAQRNGSVEVVTLENIELDLFTPLDTLDFDTDDYVLRCIPNYYRRLLHQNYVEIQAQQGKYDTDGLTIEVLYLDEDGNVTDGPTDTHAPAAPTGLTVQSFDGQNAILDWDDNTENDIAFYYIYVSGETTPLASTFGPISYAEVSLPEKQNTEICFKVSAVNEVGIESPQSSEACETPVGGTLVEFREDSHRMDNVGQDYLFSDNPADDPEHDIDEVYSTIVIKRVSVSAGWCVSGDPMFDLDWRVEIVRSDAGDTTGPILVHPNPWPCSESLCCNEFGQDGGIGPIVYGQADQSDIQSKFSAVNESAANAYKKSATFYYSYDFLLLQISVNVESEALEVVLDADQAEDSTGVYNIYLDDALHVSGLTSSDFPYLIEDLNAGQNYDVEMTYEKTDGTESDRTVKITEQPAAASETYSPVDDSYADEVNPSTIQGAREFLLVKRDGGTRRQIFMKFDITGTAIPTPITSATIRITIEGNFLGTDKTLECLRVTDDSWDEENMDWFNRPALGTVEDSVTAQASDPVDTTYSFDVTSWVENEMDGDGVVSVGFYFNAASNDAMRFYSKEDTTGGAKPELEIVP